jgi:predicted nucleic acid-binding protein
MNVALIIVLDSGPLGDACRKRGHRNLEGLTLWRHHARANGAIIAIPEIADYEVRRGLLLTGSADGVRRLDFLQRDLGHYIPISTAAMRKAAELWADARRKGIPTADEKELDCDVILAAQAMLYVGLGDSLVVATYNARHLSRYHLDARHWDKISPQS